MREVPTTWQKRYAGMVDGLIEVVSPRWHAKRLMARHALRLFSGYAGASKDRLRQNWNPMGGSADGDILDGLPDLRERSRDLNRNNSHAAAITGTVVTNIVGTGLRAQPRLDRDGNDLEDATAEEFEKAAAKAWCRWAKQPDAQNRMSFYEVQGLIQRQILENGEVLVLPLMVKNEPWRPYSLAVEIIEADRLQTPTNQFGNPNIRDGVELGERGQPIAYYIRKTHPGDILLGGIPTKPTVEWVRYPAVNKFGRPNVFHLYHVMRPGQTRGVPYFAPVMNHFKDLADYMEAELVAARVSACFAGFVKKTDPYAAAVASTSDTNSRNQRIQEIEPGMLDYLGPGEDIVFSQPSRSGMTFEPFVLGALRAIGAALGLPLELVLKDFSRTNYSSARAAMLEARRYFKNDQLWLSEKLCQPLYEMVLEEAWLRGELPAVNLFTERDEFMRCKWIAPGWGWVDPVKEVESSQLAIDVGLSTLAEECAAQGRDWEEVMEQRKMELDQMKKYGMQPLVPTSQQPKPPAGTPQEAGATEEPAGTSKGAKDYGTR